MEKSVGDICIMYTDDWGQQATVCILNQWNSRREPGMTFRTVSGISYIADRRHSS